MSDQHENLPIVPLPGSEQWSGSYDWGCQLDEAFPDQDAHDFASACGYNDAGPTVTKPVAELRMLTQGYNDGKDWVWAVRFATTEEWEAPEWWVMIAGCDYTGWDCQSSNRWTEVDRG